MSRNLLRAPCTFLSPAKYARIKVARRSYAVHASPAVQARVIHPRQENEAIELSWPAENMPEGLGGRSGSRTAASSVSRMLSRQLRDFCTCPQCRHPETNQRLLDSFLLPDDLHAVSVDPAEQGLRIRWSDGVDHSRGAGNGHESVYTWDWLRAKAAKSAKQVCGTQYWTSSIADDPPMVDYGQIMESDEGVKQWVDKIRRYGFSYVDGCPVNPEATKRLLERIAFVRRTHYGGFWDFTSDLASRDTAYTTIELGAHTDTTYFSDPAGLQMFHLLEHSRGSGGKSLLVDGFRAAQILHKEDPEAALILSRIGITAHATGNDDAKIISPRPFTVFELGQTSTVDSLDVVQIRWNNDDRGSFTTCNEHEIMTWYQAARKWKEILERKESQYWDQLRPGRPLIFDNWRVLHGRSAFTGKRRLCGGYINMDDFLSRWRISVLSEDRIESAI